MVFKKAAPSSSETADVVSFAKGLKDLFGDDKEVAATLGDAESNCMFPAQFVVLAGGFMNLLGDKAKAEDLLEQGKISCSRHWG